MIAGQPEIEEKLTTFLSGHVQPEYIHGAALVRGPAALHRHSARTNMFRQEKINNHVFIADYNITTPEF